MMLVCLLLGLWGVLGVAVGLAVSRAIAPANRAPRAVAVPATMPAALSVPGAGSERLPSA